MKHKHHIIPRHAGGTDDPSNIVELTVEEHAEAHRLLYEKYNRKQDLAAFLGLSGLASKKEIYEIILEDRRGKPLSSEVKEKISKSLTGRPIKWADKISAAHKSIDHRWLFGNAHAKGNAGKKKSLEHRKNISRAKTGKPRPDLIGNKNATALKGRKKSLDHQEAINKALSDPEVKKKISASWSIKPIVICPHCGISGKEGHNMNRYHFDNCRKLQNG